MMTLVCKNKERKCPENKDICCAECEKSNRKNPVEPGCIKCCVKPLVDECKDFEEVID